MKLVLFTILLLAVGVSEVYSLSCHMREVELCTDIYMLEYPGNGIPTDEKKVVEWCENIKEVGECMGNFSEKCLTTLQREGHTLMSGSEDDLRQMCVDGSEMRVRYLQHAECLAEGAESDEFKGYLKDLQVMFEKLFEVPYKQRFRLMCCGFRRFHHSTSTLTSRRCGLAAVEMVQGLMKMITTDLPETICEMYDPESDLCKNILPATGTAFKGDENQSQLSQLLNSLLGNY